MPNKTLLIDARPATNLAELYAALAAGINYHPIPRNLDGLADLLREARLNCLVLSQCRLSIADYKKLADVCQDLGIRVATG
ncbi:hypothetical protein WG915_09920 [Corynebacterium sp. H128]|uniref:hypothetical protein n=1 Tax=unclassified Corynebacterium TaxID=2624378 RepID=UPI0030A9607D